MPLTPQIDVVLIVGPSNSGKSTLVRALCGLGRGDHAHPDIKNVAELNWVVSGTSTPFKTLCLISSLNEGTIYDAGVSRSLEFIQQSGRNTINTISPLDMQQILNLYADPKGMGCKRAILCISDHVHRRPRPGWKTGDYATVINSGGLGQHRVTHCISLMNANQMVINGAASVNLPGQNSIRNQKAAEARRAIELI